MNRDDPEPKTRWGWMALVSVGIHALVIGGAVILASGSGPPRTLYAPSMSIGLVGPGEVGLAPGGGETSRGPTPEAKISATEAKKTPAERPRPKVEKPKREDSRVKPLKPKLKKAKTPKEVVRVPKKARRKKAPPKKRAAVPRNGAPPKKAKRKTKPAGKNLVGKELDDLEKIRRRLLARASRPAEKRGADGTRRGGGGPGKPGGGAIRGGGGGRDSYKNELARIFYAAWVLPQSLPTEDLKVDLIIHIDRGGRIVKNEIESPSGNRLFDESVLRAVAKVQTAGGLPPLPPEIPGSILAQGLRFDPKFHRGFTR